MIPPDVVSRLQVAAEPTLRPVAQPGAISDKLSDLVPGQRVMAEIQALLPNGTYRALIDQRNVTLALPFSAKSGDVLEMIVTESDGKVALAVADRQNSTESVPSTLSRAGQFIAKLFGAKFVRPQPLPLNENRPLTASPLIGRQALVPLLKQAIDKSGMFYESHQAEWIEGRFPKAGLLNEPQGRLSSPSAMAGASSTPAAAMPNALPAGGAAPETAPGTQAAPGEAAKDARSGAAAENVPDAKALAADAGKAAAGSASSANPASSADAAAANANNTNNAANAAANAARPLAQASVQAHSGASELAAPSMMPLIHQQLEALATQKFVWQGQAWPGQEMTWEIDDEEKRRSGGEAADEAGRWATRLKLSLPALGEVDLGVLLQGNRVSLSMRASRPETIEKMRAAASELSAPLDEAGLVVAALSIDAEKTKKRGKR